MGTISAETHKFCRGKVLGDGTCLYRSFISVIKSRLIEILGDVCFGEDLMKALNEDLRVRVADYIRNHIEMHDMVLNSDTIYKTVEKYCSAIEQGNLYGGDPELKALSELYGIIICLIDLTKIRKDNWVLPSYYGHNNPSATKCVYIYFNGINHFDPLFMVNVKKPDEETTIFDPDDQMVNGLLQTFIRKALKHHGKVGDVKLGIDNLACINEVSHQADGPTETQRKSNPFLPATPMKRKESELVDILMSSNNNKQLPISITNKYYASNKRVKVTKHATDRMSTFCKKNSKTMVINELIQADSVRGESDTQMNEQEIADPPMALNDEHQEAAEAE